MMIWKTTEWTHSPPVTRRTFLAAGSFCLGQLAVSPAQTDEVAQPQSSFQPLANYSKLLGTLRERGHRLRTLGAAPDTSPVVALKAGGTKKPAIFISAGSHATEQAGVVAAVELADRLQTTHEVWIVPTRDPIGLNGFLYALSLGLGELPEIEPLEAVEHLLRSRGEVLLDSGDSLLVRIGEYGYANRGLYRQVEKGARFLEPLFGRRIYFPSRAQDQPGAGPLERAYTLVVTPDGEVLHLNRFHDTAWAPAEVLAIRQLMLEIQPGLTFDLHEHGGGDFFWMSARRQRTENDEIWERRMARASIEAVANSGATLAPEDYSPGSFFEKLEPGVFWLDPSQRGEGLNLADYASAVHGPSFTIESGMRAPFDRRVRQQLLVVQTAVNVFEQRYN